MPAQGQAQTWALDDGAVPFVVTPDEIVERMLRMAEVGKQDFLIHLGSGDGRIVIAAAKHGARDLFEIDLTGASVVAFYLLPEFNARLLPRRLKLKPGTRIVAHDGGIGDWPADERLEMRTPEKPLGVGGMSRVELWVVPADASGIWASELPEHGGRWRFSVAQRFQELVIDARTQGRDLAVRNSRLRGTEIKMLVTGVVGSPAWNYLFEGRIDSARITGRLSVLDGNQTRILPWTATRIP